MNAVRLKLIRKIKMTRGHLNWRNPTVNPNHKMIGRNLRKEQPPRPRTQNQRQPISTSALRRTFIMNMRSKSREWPSNRLKSRMMNKSLILPVLCKLSLVWPPLRLYSSLQLIEDSVKEVFYNSIASKMCLTQKTCLSC